MSLTEGQVRAIAQEVVDEALMAAATSLTSGRRSRFDALGEQEDRVPDGVELEPLRPREMVDGTLRILVDGQAIDAVTHGVVQGADLLDESVAHHDSSSVGPDVAASGSNPTVEAAGDVLDVDSSVGRVAENHDHEEGS